MLVCEKTILCNPYIPHNTEQKRRNENGINTFERKKKLHKNAKRFKQHLIVLKWYMPKEELKDCMLSMKSIEKKTK